MTIGKFLSRRAAFLGGDTMRKYWPLIAFAVFVAVMIVATLIADLQLNDFHP